MKRLGFKGSVGKWIINFLPTIKVAAELLKAVSYTVKGIKN